MKIAVIPSLLSALVRTWGHQLVRVGVGRLVCAGLALCGLLALQWWIFQHARAEREEEIRGSLQSFTETTRQSLRTWAEGMRARAAGAADLPAIRTVAEALSRASADSREALHDRASEQLSLALRRLPAGHAPAGQSGFLLVAASGGVLASDFGPATQEAAQRLSAAAREALGGMQALRLVRPAASVSGDSETWVSAAQTSVAVASPVRDEQGNIIAALVFEVAAQADLNGLLERHAAGGQGSTFLFSSDGRIIASTAALGGLDRQTAAGHPVTSQLAPSASDDRTSDAAAAPLRQADANIRVNLADHPGLQNGSVVEAWCVLPEIGLGLVTELPYDESFRSLDRLWNTLVVLTLVSTLCLVLVMYGRGTRSESHEETPAPGRRSSAWAILAVSLLATGLTWMTTKSSVDRQDQTRFQTEVERIRDGWLDRMQRLAETLQTLRTSYHAFGPLEEGEWIQLVESLGLEKNLPEIGYVAYIEPSKGETDSVLDAQIRGALGNGSLFSAESEAASGFPIQYIKLTRRDFPGGESPVGKAAREARDAGRVTVSRHQPGGAVRDGIVLLAAIYEEGVVPQTPESRRAAHRGWIVVAARVGKTMQAVARKNSPEVVVELYDGLQPGPKTLVYDRGSPRASGSDSDPPRFEEIVPVTIGGQTWTLRCASTSAFDLPITKNHPAQVLLGGLAISILLFDIALIMDSTRSRALAIAELMTRRLRDSEARIRAVVDHAPDGIITFSHYGTISTFNPGAERLFGYSAEEVQGQRIGMLMPACMPGDGPDPDLDGERPALAKSICREVTGHRKDGTRLPVELTISELRAGDRPMFTAIVRDISARKQAEEALRESEERYALAARAANDGLWDWDVQTGEIYFSPRWKAMLGLNENEMGNRPADWLDRVHADDRARLRAVLADHLADRSTHFEAECRVLHKDGRYRWMLSRGLAVRDSSGQALRIAGSQADITARKEAERRLLHDAMYDSLTGLPNRAHFIRQLERALQDTRQRPGRLFALLFLDLDRFKVVNDSLGHYVGDQLLVAIADRLKHCVRPTDTIARLGGDEFAILLVNLTDVTEATAIAERIQSDLALPFMVGQNEVFTAVSIGITISSEGIESTDSLIRDADTAMYRAKASGKGGYEMFDQGMHTRAVERLLLETQLRRALEREEFRIHYQPIVSLDSGEISGCEALIRWEHPERGLVLPDQFVPVAEETGLIAAMSEWLMGRACAQMKSWIDSGLPPIRLSVNISPRQLKQQNLFDAVSLALSESGLDASLLQLELTESALMENADATIQPLVELYGKGVQIALDDFGTGYSSLIYLRRFPISVLKIDGSFVGEIASDPGDAAITAGLIALGRSLGLRVVVEGVETREQLECLRSQKCDEVQGYYISRPLDAAAFGELLRAASPLRTTPASRSGKGPLRRG